MNRTTILLPDAGTQSSWRRGALQWMVTIVVALLATLVIKTWVLEAYVIPSGSMEPTIHLYDRVLVDKLDFRSIRRGDIIVFAKAPADTDGGDIHHLIKRVIGLPGETLRSGPNGEIFVDGKPISQPWITAAALDAPQPTICDGDPGFSRIDCVGDTLYLPRGEYYVMGDNRADSDDSRYWGPVASRLIVGPAFVRIWPLSRLHWF